MQDRLWTGSLAAAVSALVLQPLAAVVAPGHALAVAAAALFIGVLAATLVRVPPRPTAAPRPGRWRSVALGLLALLGGLQAVRVATFRADASQIYGAAFPFDSTAIEHECLPAYLYAVELVRRGDDPYDAESFPGSAARPEAVEVRTAVDGMAPHVDDPFFYPPTFLLGPRLALLPGLDYATTRSIVFGLNGLLFLAAALVLARSVGGSRGVASARLVAAVGLSFPVALGLQFAQFHLAAFALALLGLLAIERDRPAVGALLLAASIAGKLFPGVFVLTLVGARRWRALAWVAAWLLLFTALAWLVFGVEVFRQFAHHLPRLSSGEAASFTANSAFATAENASLHGVFQKLEFLGLEGAARLGPLSSLPYTILVLALAFFVGRRAEDPLAQATGWLSVLGLAAARSPYAPAAYALAGGVWLLSLLAPGARRPASVAAVVLTWGVQGRPSAPAGRGAARRALAPGAARPVRDVRRGAPASARAQASSQVNRK